MTKSHDIREWARATGREIGDRGPIPIALKQDYERNEQYSEQWEGEHVPPADDDEVRLVIDDPADDWDPPVEETAPKIPTTADRVRSSFRAKKAAARARTAKPKPGKSAGKATPRVSTEDVMSAVWGGLGALVFKGGFAPSGYMMTKQAPVAGMLLDDALKGTAIDKMAQPFARQSERARLLKALLLPPMAAGVLQARPDLYPQVAPILRKSIGDWLEVAGPKAEIIMQRNADFEKKYGEDIDDIMGGLESILAMVSAQRSGSADAA